MARKHGARAGMTHSIDPIARWHRESYDRFINGRLPELLSQRLPLEAYTVTEDGPDTCAVALALAGESGAAHVRIEAVPRPDDTGVFRVGGVELVVIPVASSEELDTADVSCVGEQLYEISQ